MFPTIGHFSQADSVIMPEGTQGMNRYMYVQEYRQAKKMETVRLKI